MNHKAFWVHNTEEDLPDIRKTQLSSARITPTPGARAKKQLVELEIDKRVHDGYNPIPIDKKEKLTSPEKK